VVLQGNERDGDTRVAAEPELEGMYSVLAGVPLRGTHEMVVSELEHVRIQSNTSRALGEHQVVRVADHGVEHLDVTGLRRELGPDLHPVTILAVNALAADLNLNLLEQAVADVVQPAEARTGRCR
jgi:hypothetical protein